MMETLKNYLARVDAMSEQELKELHDWNIQSELDPGPFSYETRPSGGFKRGWPYSVPVTLFWMVEAEFGCDEESFKKIISRHCFADALRRRDAMQENAA